MQRLCLGCDIIAPFHHIISNCVKESMELIPPYERPHIYLGSVCIVSDVSLHWLDGRIVLAWLFGTRGCLCYLPDQCETRPTALDDVLMCSSVPLGFIALLLADFIISLIAVSTQLSVRGAIGVLCVCVCVCECVYVDGGVKLALSFSLIGARTRPSGYSLRSLSLHLCVGIGAVNSACHCWDIQPIMVNKCLHTHTHTHRDWLYSIYPTTSLFSGSSI